MGNIFRGGAGDTPVSSIDRVSNNYIVIQNADRCLYRIRLHHGPSGGRRRRGRLDPAGLYSAGAFGSVARLFRDRDTGEEIRFLLGLAAKTSAWPALSRRPRFITKLVGGPT
ncbi:hypothetical protein EVAR_23900_1 [Eumeta japonica]|uniref:Uncharacterized protein n=1 Tax=Eumeta variegata TaxID=151549 RepID=A0A4C1V5F5_EUMVA|nr:hypothetical protein EVAR_23900_1 [Eumeta japonica]